MKAVNLEELATKIEERAGFTMEDRPRAWLAVNQEACQLLASGEALTHANYCDLGVLEMLKEPPKSMEEAKRRALGGVPVESIELTCQPCLCEEGCCGGSVVARAGDREGVFRMKWVWPAIAAALKVGAELRMSPLVDGSPTGENLAVVKDERVVLMVTSMASKKGKQDER